MIQSFTYDSLSRLTSAYNPESGAVAYQYDNNGNLTHKKDARNVWTHFSYDVLNRVTRKWYNSSSSSTTNGPLPAGVGATGEVVYTYDTGTYAKGQLVSVANDLYRTDIGNHDVLGRPQRSRQWKDSFSRAYYDVTQTYNLSGAVVSQVYPSGNSVSYTYDSAGRLSSFQGNLGEKVQRTYSSGIGYNAFGAIERERFSGMTGQPYQKMVFNGRGQMTQVGLSADGVNFNGGGSIVNNYGTTDNNGNVKTQQIIVADGSSFNQTYSYDPLNRLKSVTEQRYGSTSFNQTFDYDRWGNRKINASATFNAPEPPVDVQTTTNRVYAPATSGFAGDIALLGSDLCNPVSTQRKICYDSVGNMTRDKHSINAGVMVYDAENRLVSHSTESGYTVNFSYDGNGRRVNMQAGEYSTTFVYGLGGELMYETGKSVLKHYGYRSGQLLVTVSSVTRFPDVRWLVTDHLGTPRIVLDQNGTKTRHDYLPFGEEIGSTIGGRSASYGYPTYPQSDNIKQQFTGYERDNETGLDFAQARYFGSSLGRFTSPDPENAGASADNPQTWNAYAYVGNNPINITDPDGLSWYFNSSIGEAGQYKWYEDNETPADGFRLINGSGNHVYYAGEGVGYVALNPLANKFQTFDTQAAALNRVDDIYTCPSCQGLVNSVAENAETKGRTVRIVGTAGAAAGVCIGTAGVGCAAATKVAADVIASEVSAAQENRANAGIKPPGFGPGWVKMRGDQGYKDPDGNFWKKDMKHKDHWDVSDKNGRRVKEVDFGGKKLSPGGPKNKNRRF